MPAPAQPYLDLVTGTVHGTITSPGTFSWYNSHTTGGISCSVSGVETWCTASAYNSIAPQTSMSANVKTGLATGNYGFICPCCELGSPKAPIQGGHDHPFPPKK